MTRQKVLKMLAEGCSRAEISQSLNITLHVVDYHCRNLLKSGCIRRKPQPKCIYDVTEKGKFFIEGEENER